MPIVNKVCGIIPPMFEFKETEIKKAFSLRFGDRISHLAAAGSIVNERSNHSSDLDLLLILHGQEEGDLVLCREAVRSLAMYKIDLSLKYLNELPDKAEDFQDGPRTSLCLAYMSSAHFIIGNNIFTEILHSLPLNEFRKSIIHAVGEYLMRMESAYFTADKTTLNELQKQCFKYLTRIIIDVQLFFSPSDMGPYKLLKRPEMLALGKEDPRISRYIAPITEESSPENLINTMALLYRYLIANIHADVDAK